jgi:hypothetical protein
MANSARKTSSTTLTIRVAGGNKQKNAWKQKAKRAGMSLTLYVCYVMDRTDLVVSMSHQADPREVDANAGPLTIMNGIVDGTRMASADVDAGQVGDGANGANGAHDRPSKR